jgi:hypothetical protein
MNHETKLIKEEHIHHGGEEAEPVPVTSSRTCTWQTWSRTCCFEALAGLVQTIDGKAIEEKHLASKVRPVTMQSIILYHVVYNITTTMHSII